MKHFKNIILVLILISLFISCGGRVPSPQTARSVSLKYFKQYGHKYPSTEFFGNSVKNVAINHIQETSYHFALVDSLVEFTSGQQIRALAHLEYRFPRGWKIVSWEKLQ